MKKYNNFIHFQKIYTKTRNKLETVKLKSKNKDVQQEVQGVLDVQEDLFLHQKIREVNKDATMNALL